MACFPREHGHGLPRKTRGTNFLDEVQEHPIHGPPPEHVELDKCRGAKGRAEDVDAVFFRPLPVAIGVRLVRQDAAV